jgi:hypothetical protein
MNTKAVQVRYEQAIIVVDESCGVADVFLTTPHLELFLQDA